MLKKLTFATYPTLQAIFKEHCELRGISMTNQINMLTKQYLNGEINIETLVEHFAKNKKKDEKKDFKLGIQIDSDLYLRLKENLKKTSTNPSSFFTWAMCYCISKNPLQREDFANKAQLVLQYAEPNITHVVYGLRFYAPQKDAEKWGFLTEHYFIDTCTEERFQEIYKKNTPIYDVLAVHR